ncbi:olfactory receptor 52E8-like [Periophthalmus magnuspinnatus]|uniref:olfactory receptor 52E8-like n=1 Tax=Periophthalmus magnuspinnatus TaxID=409849 RepID=UPI00145A8564|nr:olfactory receptor 52E8-like [Periophthalmus magnuspinnatus]
MLVNLTKQDHFTLLGFPGLHPQYYGPVSAVMFFVYLVIGFGNIFILVFVMCEKKIQKPTYLIFCHIALSDLTFGTVTLPKIIAKYWFGNSLISFYGCFVQMFFVHYLGSVQSFNLMVMALDRFISICLPMRYPVLISNTVVSVLCGISWLIPLPVMVTVVLQAVFLPFCKSNVIAQCYCDHISIMSQTCTERFLSVSTTAVSLAMFCLLLPLAFILFSYTSIIVMILKMTNANGRRKTFSTCTPQILITCLFYLPRCFVYLSNLKGFSFSLDFRSFLIMLYSLLPAAVNPVIYCFKTQNIKQSLFMKLHRARISIEQNGFPMNKVIRLE